MRCLMISGGLYVMNFKIVRFLNIFMEDQVIIWYTNNTQLTCSLFNGVVPAIIILTNLFFVLCTKTYLVANTLRFLSLDHNKLSKIIICVMLTFIAIEVLILYLVYGTLCTKQKLYFLRTKYKIDLPEDRKYIPTVYYVHMIMLVIPVAIDKILKIKNSWKNRR